ASTRPSRPAATASARRPYLYDGARTSSSSGRGPVSFDTGFDGERCDDEEDAAAGLRAGGDRGEDGGGITPASFATTAARTAEGRFGTMYIVFVSKPCFLKTYSTAESLYGTSIESGVRPSVLPSLVSIIAPSGSELKLTRTVAGRDGSAATGVAGCGSWREDVAMAI